MASNFRIAMHHDGGTLHFRLLGDFDGISACQLLENLKKSYSGINRVMVHAESLKTIHPFGRDVLRGRFHELNGHSTRIFFVGEKAKKIAPEKALHLQDP